MMVGRRLRVLAAVPLFILAAGLAGCGGSEDGPGVATAERTPSAGRSANSAAGDDEGKQVREYVACMRARGVVMVETSEGLPQVDKEHTPLKKIKEAAEKCRELQPVATAPARLSPEDIEKRGRYAACLRKHGLPEYPDPDPQTGETEMDDELAEKIKSNPKTRAALEACRGFAPAKGGSVVTGG